ncbi:competence protein CoiA [Virgibacillus alimentarius]|uniref:competence protein CoiA n=1 Tax=Virgibacillus alimentarius TaxID=698769 RepID=UPI0004932C31|nr:competence protein CoiA family protein [Virgibacillus alimentarius]
MLQAESSEGNLITLVKLTRKEIEREREGHLFYCPSCREEVIIKAGSKIIPHFAHKSAQYCPSSEGGEGPYHEKGKLLLYRWLKKQQLQVELEAYVPEIHQRPDLLLRINDKKIAIEYQCARIPISQVIQRNEGYKTLGITPIWILGAGRFKRQTKDHFKVDQFTLQFIHMFTSFYPPTLFYFCPDKHQFAIIQDMYFSKMSQVISKCSIFSLKTCKFTDLFHQHTFLPFHLYQLWGKEKRDFRLRPKRHLYGEELKWHQWLYLKRTMVECLPSIIHLPVAAQYRMKTPLWNWQSRLIIDLLHPIPLHGHFSIHSCKNIIKNHFYHTHHFPLIHSTDCPVYQYLQLLKKLNIIKQQSSNVFQKIKPILFYKNIEKAIQGDEALIKYLQNLPI